MVRTSQLQTLLTEPCIQRFLVTLTQAASEELQGPLATVPQDSGEAAPLLCTKVQRLEATQEVRS